jgi:hypothetical protein
MPGPFLFRVISVDTLTKPLPTGQTDLTLTPLRKG